MSEKQQQLVLSIIDFLNQSIQDGTVKSDDKEGLEVAIQCIGEAFGVDPSDDAQVKKLSVKPASLQNIFDVFIKTRQKVSSPGASTPVASTSNGPSAKDKAEAEKLKATGNQLMSAKNYDGAIESYTKAIELDGGNPVFYSNRAAAYSSKNDHLSAIGDAEKAIAIDSAFVKAYHRLGHAQFCLGDYTAAAAAFERGLKLDPSNAGLKSGLQNAKARITDQPPAPAPVTPAARSTPAGGSGGLPDLSSMASMFSGGGMPDLASMMNNPDIMAMASQMAQNGSLASLMQSPGVSSMMERIQQGDMPSMSELMADPQLRTLASQFGAGGAGGAGSQ